MYYPKITPQICQLNANEGRYSPAAGCMSLASATLIPIPEGWVPLGDIQPGQEVFDPFGNPCKVTAVCRPVEQEVFRIIFHDGAHLLAGSQQPWSTLTHALRFRIHAKRFQLQDWAARLMCANTEDIRNCLRHERGLFLKESMHSIPLPLTLNLPERHLPIHPYLLGLWLGDGSSGAAIITCHIEDEDHYRVRASAAGERWRIMRDVNKVLSCALTRGPKPLFLERLRELNVFKNKHVPLIYLRSGETQRLDLLQGLMDSDGYIDEIRGGAEFVSTSQTLAKGVRELLLTLGQKATLSKGKATLNGVFISYKWRVHFTPTIMVMSLPRKAQRLTKFLEARSARRLTRLNQRYIRAVKPMGVRPTICLAVDSHSGMFLAGEHMIPVQSRRVS